MGYSAFYLMYGRECLLPSDLQGNTWTGLVRQNTSDEHAYQYRVNELREVMAVRDAAQDLLWEKREAQRDRHAHTLPLSHTPLEVGDAVLLWRSNMENSFTGKMEPKWEGPFWCATKLGNSFQLSKMDGSLLPTWESGHHLKRYYYSEDQYPMTNGRIHTL